MQFFNKQCATNIDHEAQQPISGQIVEKVHPGGGTQVNCPLGILPTRGHEGKGFSECNLRVGLRKILRHLDFPEGELFQNLSDFGSPEVQGRSCSKIFIL